MNTLSIFIIIIGVASLIYGFSRGIIKELGSLCSILLGIIACRLFGDHATTIAAGILGVDPQANPISHYAASMVGNAGLFCAVWLAVFVIARLLHGAIHAIHLGFIDSLLGAAFCAAKWLLVLSLILNLIYIMAPTAGMWGANPPEGIIKAILAYAPWLFGALTAPGAAPEPPAA